MGHLYVIEGIDGAGKTTVARALAATCGAVYYKTPPARYCRRRADYECPGRERARFFFYLEALQAASDDLRVLLRRRDVVCDRYWLSTIVYHEALICEDLQSHLDGLHLVPPNGTVVLVADEATIRRRMLRRGRSRFDARLEADRDLQHRVLQGYLRRVLPHQILDTGHVDPSCVVARCGELLGHGEKTVEACQELDVLASW